MKKIIIIAYFFFVSFAYAMENKRTNPRDVLNHIEKNILDKEYSEWKLSSMEIKPLTTPFQAWCENYNELTADYEVIQKKDSPIEFWRFVFNGYTKYLNPWSYHKKK